MKKRMIWAFTLVGILLVACSGTSIDGNWQLSMLDSNPVLPDYPISFDVDSGQVNGHAGCNNYSGTISVKGDTLSLGPMASTEMACADQAAMQQESDFHATLLEVSRYQFEESGDLWLLDAGGATRLVFAPAGAR